MKIFWKPYPESHPLPATCRRMHGQLKLIYVHTVTHHVVKSSKQTNKRTDGRLDISLKVIVIYSDGRRAIFHTRNMSATGLFLDRGNNELPATDSIIQVQIAAEQGMQDAPLVKAKVTRKTDDGIGIMFLTA